jgi:uncharacterized protein (TIGR02594 family)
MIATPKWLDIAFGEVGVSEVPGPGANPRIVEYDACTTLKSTSDEVPWCSAFLCWVMEQAGEPSTRSAMARSWTNYGIPAVPVVGCVTVLRRGSNPAQGHVGLLLDRHDGWVYLLSGNTGNRVEVARFPESDVLSYRLPE